MKDGAKLLISTLFLLFIITINAQTKRVLLEEFTGARCGQCPMGSYMLDSLLEVYPDLIGVSLHSYQTADAMFFPEIDTIGIAYAPGAPLGAADRIYWGDWAYVAETDQYWNSRIQSRLSVIPELTVSVNPAWNSVSRNITAQITTEILANMPTGDYRFNLYIVEDSVTGSGPGYDQVNYYNTVPGNPFYGLGNPITGYVHRHVVRAVLPQTWGSAGIISSTPVSGQNFSTTINYILPAGINENRVKLVAFVSKFTANHQGDEIINAVEINLLSPSGINDLTNENNISVYPGTNSGIYIIESNIDKAELTIYNLTGEILLSRKIEKSRNCIDITSFANGVYIISVDNGTNTSRHKIVKN